MEKKESSVFPKVFFTQPRPTINMKEAIKDDSPFVWSNSVEQQKSKVSIVSLNKNN